MIINRNNYEEFFLLYIDNELSAVEKAAVEAFVMQHPDLQEELQLLQQTVLLPEESLAFNKSFLFKSESTINDANFEETALLYIDNELSETEKKNLEHHLTTNTKHQAAFSLLQQTKLPLEIVDCPNKEALYKKEENKRPIVWMRFARIAVAAVLIGLGIVVYTIVPTNNQVIEPTVTSNSIQLNEKNTASAVTKTNANTYTITEATNTAKTTKIQTAVNNNSLQQNKKVIKPAIVVSPNIQKETLVLNNKANVENESINNNNVQQQPNIKDKDALVSIESPKKLKITEQQIAPTATTLVAATNDNNIQQNASLAQTTVYKELDTDNENKSLYVGNLELNKDKIRGFLRKASRLLGNKAKNEGESTVKSSFAVNK